MLKKLLIILFSILISSSFIQVKAQDINISQPIPGQYIVKFKDSAESSDSKANKLAKKHGIENLNVYNNSFKGANVKVPKGKENDLANDPDVELLVQDFTISAIGKPEDVIEGTKGNSIMGGMGGTSTQVLPAGINWIDAELNTTNEGNGIKVAVLDTGIDFSHPDLMVNTTLSRDFSGDNTGGRDNNTSIGGHGTHVAGVIAALNNTRDVLGVGSQIDLVSVKVLKGTGSGSFGSIISGLDYVTANANVISVANLSLGAVGGSSPSQSFLDASSLLRAAIQRAVNTGVICVVAAGNDGGNISTINAVPAMYPEVISVSALSDSNGLQGDDSWASFSNYGSEVDIIAPGVNILSTAIGGGTSSLSGTSFSAPHVAGTVGLYVSKNGRPSNANATLLSSLINAISQVRSPLSGEPSDGYIEPSCYANGTALK